MKFNTLKRRITAGVLSASVIASGFTGFPGTVKAADSPKTFVAVDADIKAPVFDASNFYTADPVSEQTEFSQVDIVNNATKNAYYIGGKPFSLIIKNYNTDKVHYQSIYQAEGNHSYRDVQNGNEEACRHISDLSDRSLDSSWLMMSQLPLGEPTKSSRNGEAPDYDWYLGLFTSLAYTQNERLNINAAERSLMKPVFITIDDCEYDYTPTCKTYSTWNVDDKGNSLTRTYALSASEYNYLRYGYYYDDEGQHKLNDEAIKYGRSLACAYKRSNSDVRAVALRSHALLSRFSFDNDLHSVTKVIMESNDDQVADMIRYDLRHVVPVCNIDVSKAYICREAAEADGKLSPGGNGSGISKTFKTYNAKRLHLGALGCGTKFVLPVQPEDSAYNSLSSFKVSGIDGKKLLHVSAGDTYSFSYNGATAGDYISAIIYSNDDEGGNKILYETRIKKVGSDDNGKAEITIPSDEDVMAPGKSFKLAVFEEKVSPTAYGTNLASPMACADFTVISKDLSHEGVRCVIAEEENTTYTGKKLTPSIEVTDANGIEITAGVDYDVNYGRNTDVADKITATIKGKGSYKGEKTFTFEMAKADIGSASIKNTDRLKADSYYTGRRITKPDPEIAVSEPAFKDYTLVKDKDYTITYGENTEIGDGSVSISGIGNFTGVRTVLFKIVDSNIAGEPGESIRMNDEGGVTISVENGKKLSDATLKKLMNDPEIKSFTFEGKVSGYSIKEGMLFDESGDKLLAIPAGVVIASRGDVEKLLKKIGQTSLSMQSGAFKVSNSLKNTYTISADGSTPDPDIGDVSLNGWKLEKDKDYTVSYAYDLKGQKGFATVTGKGIFKGSFSIPFDLKSTGKVIVDLYSDSSSKDGSINLVPDSKGLSASVESSILNAYDIPSGSDSSDRSDCPMLSVKNTGLYDLLLASSQNKIAELNLNPSLDNIVVALRADPVSDYKKIVDYLSEVKSKGYSGMAQAVNVHETLTYNGISKEIDTLGEPLDVAITIPDSLQKTGREYMLYLDTPNGLEELSHSADSSKPYTYNAKLPRLGTVVVAYKDTEGNSSDDKKSSDKTDENSEQKNDVVEVNPAPQEQIDNKNDNSSENGSEIKPSDGKSADTKTKISAPPKAKSLKLKTKKKYITVTAAHKSGKIGGYRIAFRKKGAKKWKYKSISVKKNAKLKAKIKAGKTGTWQVKVCTWKKANGKKIYSKYTGAKKTKIK